jgi:hypothetical protein
MLRLAAKSVLGSTAAAVDRAATLAAYAQTSRRRRRSRSESLGHGERLAALEQLLAAYEDASSDFFVSPAPIRPRRRHVRSLEGGAVEDVFWTNTYEPFLEGIADRYRRGGGDPTARLFRHREPRSALILVHGYMAGQHRVEERVWPTSWLYRRGLDLAFYVLPHHGIRGPGRRFAPPRFPGSDPRITNEGFRQAMSELTSLVSWLLDSGHPRVGIMGMSLGGYTTALAATVESRLSCAVPVIPLTSIADFARDQGRLGTTPSEEVREHRALDRVHHIISPLHRAPLLAPEQMLIVAAEADRITPVRHAQRLGRHFGAPVETWHGGHLLQFGRRNKFRRIGAFLGETGTVPRSAHGRQAFGSSSVKQMLRPAMNGSQQHSPALEHSLLLVQPKPPELSEPMEPRLPMDPRLPTEP